MAIQTPNGFNLDNSGKRIVVDPVTRIEGHLRVEVNVDDNNVIRNAVSTGTMWRGIEVILQGPRSARRLGLHRAHLRRLHRHPCADLGARGRGRARHHDPRERQLDPQHDAADAAGARSHRALLSSACARLGRRRLGAVGRSEGDVACWRSRSRLAAVVARLFQGSADAADEIRRVRAARAVQERLLGPRRLQAAARSQSDGGRALSRGARFPEGDRQDPYHLRRQEPASELAGRRRALRDQCRWHGRGRRDQHGAAQSRVLDHRPPHRVHRKGLSPGRARDRLVLQGLALWRRALRQERHGLWRHSRTRQRLFRRRTCSCRAA